VQIIGACCELYCLEYSIQLDDQMSSSRTLWELVMSVLTHPAARLVQENLPSAGFMEFAPIVFGMYIRICKLCTFISDRIDQQLNVLIFKQCHWNAVLTQALSTCMFLCVVNMPFGNATSNETRVCFL
jgi:uncharacterized protein YggT (Ycf19 family)